MSYHSHKLNSVYHSHIIERTDPITGDAVKENDSVVFCSICKSCFLEDSWMYMNEQHCEQNQTLEAVPALPIKLIAKKGKSQLITELLSLEMNYDAIIVGAIIPFFLTLFSISAIELNFEIELNYGITLLAGVMGAMLAAMMSSTTQFRKIIGNHEDDVRIFRTYIELGKERISLDRIRQIKYQRETYVERVNDREIYTQIFPSLLVYFDTGSLTKKVLPTGDYKKTATFLRGLEQISYFKEVFFYSENQNEYETMQRIQSNSNGHIVIGEPARLFH
ncbi:hypothetical protein ACE193_02650 [Bernardetia sp. OM2101]|uniref:hypothetical protein n=1 Tax=Bernardetia sp. OM2101 TaxID=3344876 RepID=UPI0035CFEC8D